MGEIVLALLEFIAYGTGELILCAATLGKHKPALPDQGKKSRIVHELSTSLSTWIGVLFWCSLLVLIARLISAGN